MVNKNDEHSGLRRWALRIAWTLGTLLLVAILLRLSLKTDTVQRWVKSYAVSTVNKQLNAELSIEELSGDLWKEATLSGVHLVQKDTIAQVDSIYAAYNIWAIFGGRIELSDLEIYQPRTNLRQEGDQWNVQQIAPASSDTSSSMLAFSINNLLLKDGQISVRSNNLPADSSLTVNNLELSSSLGFEGEVFNINLQDLSFQVENTQLDSPLRVQTSAKAQQNSITLEKLIFATGNSVIQSKGYASSADSTIQFDMLASPISWKDITRYAQRFPLRENVEIDLALSGNPEQFGLTLTLESPGVKSFRVNSRFQWKASLVLQQIDVSAEHIRLHKLLSDTTLPGFQDFQFNFSGQVNFSQYQQAHGDISFSAQNITQSTRHLDHISANGSIADQNAMLTLDMQQDQQNVTADFRVNQWPAELPSVEATINGAHINPAFWIQDTSYTGDLSFRSEISGRGWYPQKSLWNYSLDMAESRFMGQPVANLSVKGTVDSNTVSAEARAKIREGVIDISAGLESLDENPEYAYTIRTDGLDLGTLMGQPDFKTAINSNITGNGRGFDPASMQLNTSVSIDSSLVNKELVQNLSADLSIRNSVATIDTASLQSTIAEGAFSLRMNILQQFDPENKLSFDLRLKDLEPLAPLADVEDLHAEGELEGELTPSKDERLQFLGTLDLSDVKYNALFMTERARGSLEMHIKNEVSYLADLDLSAPSFSGIQLQDLELNTEGNYADSVARGNLDFQFTSPNEGRIEQAGSYLLAKDSIRVRTTTFNIVSDYRTLALERPFELTVRNDTLRMDTLRIASGNDAYLEMGAPLVSESEQHGFIRGKMLNTAVIQHCLFGKSYFKGLLSGQFEITRKDTNLDASGELVLSEMEYLETRFDSLRISGKVENDRLEGLLSLQHEGKELIQGDADLPFKLGDPEQFPPSFFEERVSGSLRVRDVAIKQLDSLFAQAGITQTSGIFSLRGTLDGKAGEPKFTADASLRNAKLSGVSVDSVTAGIDYSHEDAELQLNASVISFRQKAAQINARFPLFIDMKTFRVNLPEDKDRITMNIATDDFNLRALSDFLDRRTLRELKGQLNGNVQITGPVEDLKTEGKLVLKDGAFRLMPAGITVDHIQLTINFDPDQVRLTKLSAKSGKGNLNASGKIALQKLVPGNLALQVEAKNFRAANTSQYNAVVNVDAEASGSLTKPKITGKLDFITGFLKLQNFGEKSVETIELDSLEENGPKVNVYDSLALDMDMTFNRRFYIRNQRYLEMEIELEGGLDLLKESGGDLQVFGTITTPNGYARPFGKEFELEEGTVGFNGEPINPQLMVRTRYEPPQTQEEIVIWYVIEGTVENPKFKYESQPPMELENIISYTLFGQPFYALDSWKQVVASSNGNTTASDVALDVLLDRVEALATQKLGIDVVKIDNSRAGGETGTSITTGWYLNPKVFFAIQNVVTGSVPDTGFLLEYMLQKDLKLIIRQGNDMRQGVDLKWNYDY